MILKSKKLFSILFVFFLPICVQADSLSNNKEALDIIADFAERICPDQDFSRGGEEYIKFKANAKAELNKLIKKLVNLGIEGAGKYERKEFQGFLHKDLLDVYKVFTICRLDVFNKLHDKLLSNIVPSPNESENVSCQAIKNTDPSAKDGLYKLSRTDGSTYNAYCNMTNDGEGWTLVAKLQKDTSYWRYDSASWTEQNMKFNAEDFNLKSGEARYPSFEIVPFSQIRVVDPINHGRMTAVLSADNLLSVFQNPNRPNIHVLELSSNLFIYLSSRPDDIWGVCSGAISNLSSRIRINNDKTYPPRGRTSDTGDTARSQARLGTVSHGSNSYIWPTTNDCAIGLGVKTFGFGGRKVAGTTTQSGFSTIWVR